MVTRRGRSTSEGVPVQESGLLAQCDFSIIGPIVSLIVLLKKDVPLSQVRLISDRGLRLTTSREVGEVGTGSPPASTRTRRREHGIHTISCCSISLSHMAALSARRPDWLRRLSSTSHPTRTALWSLRSACQLARPRLARAVHFDPRTVPETPAGCKARARPKDVLLCPRPYGRIEDA